MSDDTERFYACLYEAEAQLQWGTDPKALDAAARALSRFEPSHVLVGQLALRIADLWAARRKLAHRRLSRPPGGHRGPVCRAESGRASGGCRDALVCRK